MKLHRQTEKSGFTRTELVITLVVLAVVLGLVGPALVPGHHRPNFSCSNNLRQDSIAFRLWAQDHNDRFPIQVSVTNEGAMEEAWNGDLAAVFRVMSNELNTPRILVCPADKGHIFATNFSEGLRLENISYFVSFDATETNPAAFQSGDANISGLSSVGKNQFELRMGGTNYSWDDSRHVLSYRRHILGFNYSPIGCGNMAFADGSVQALKSEELNQAWLNSGMATNRLLMP